MLLFRLLMDIINFTRMENKKMTNEDKAFLDKINKYAEKVLKDIDPQKTQVSLQLEKLKPVMEELSKETGLPIEDVFIKYMDLQSENSIEVENQFKKEMGPNFDFKMPFN